MKLNYRADALCLEVNGFVSGYEAKEHRLYQGAGDSEVITLVVRSSLQTKSGAAHANPFDTSSTRPLVS